VVADVFHLIRLGLTALDEVHRRRQQQIHGHRGHKDHPLFKLRRVLRVGQERLTESKRHKIFDRLRADRTRGLDLRRICRRCGCDPGRDRRPGPLRHRPRLGQARGAGTPRQRVRGLQSSRPGLGPRPAAAANRDLARRLERAAPQPDYTARYRHLTTRDNNQLAYGQARAAIGGTLIGQLHAICTSRVPGTADIAAGRPEEVAMAAD
jgi:hypothetical protein